MNIDPEAFNLQAYQNTDDRHTKRQNDSHLTFYNAVLLWPKVALRHE